jgi:hypothetical protein
MFLPVGKSLIVILVMVIDFGVRAVSQFFPTYPGGQLHIPLSQYPPFKQFVVAQGFFLQEIKKANAVKMIR